MNSRQISIYLHIGSVFSGINYIICLRVDDDGIIATTKKSCIIHVPLAIPISQRCTVRKAELITNYMESNKKLAHKVNYKTDYTAKLDM